ncbi:MAG: LysM peptidoglycan-binding domain-containing protein, partial [Chloroflexi bacterium]|nr:LysM peptidoglycan-binding domain-containing protein [Chloroflexota bacterium]
HSILSSDLQAEQQLNPLWPVRTASREEVLTFAEDAPIGSAKTGLIQISAPTETETPVEKTAEISSPVAQATSPVPATRPSIVDSSSTAEPVVFLLQAGDNLTRISARYGIPIDAILAANGIANPNRIYVGLPLTIPAAADVVESPGAPAPVASEPDEPVADASTRDATTATYLVKRGDSAFTIARQFGVDVDDLLAGNGIVNRNRVYIGQTLTIPD